MTVLRVDGLAKRFGHLEVLKGLDLTIGPDELVALVGENAAGKTTLVRCVGRSLVHDRGTIEVQGQPLGATPGDVQGQGVAIVWQDLALCDNLDTAANLFLGHEPGGLVMGEHEMYDGAASVLARIGVHIDDLGTPVGRLSGGQRQAVALARALLVDPVLLILDEPTAALDRQGRAAFGRLIDDRRAAGGSILLISHDLEQVCGLADRILVLRDGRIVADVTAAEVHPDDVAALMSGIEVDSTARRQLRRLHSLVDQLSGARPTRTLPLIVSAIAVAINQERLCVHLVDGGVLRRSAAIGLPAQVLAATDTVPVGDAGGMIGRAASSSDVVIVEDIRVDSSWRELATVGIRSAWAAPIVGSSGVLGTISGYRDTVGAVTADELELVSLYASHAAAVIEREGLLDVVTRRNRVLETLGGMLEVLAGPEAATSGRHAALRALTRGLGTTDVALFVEHGDAWLPETSGPVDPERLDTMAAAARRVTGDDVAELIDGRAALVAVPIATQHSRAVVVARWDDDQSRDDRVELLRDAAHSLRLSFERAAFDEVRAESDALRRSRDLQREFLMRISHELRTPLTAIHGYADTLRQTDVSWDGASTERFLSMIAKESGRLGRLVSDLLDASAIESGVMRLDLDWCDVGLLAEAAVACVPVEPPTVVDLAVAPDVPPVRADHDRLQQVVVNLVDNAVRHTPPGTKVRVEVRLAVAADAAGDAVEIRVVDDGPGVPADLADTVFEPHTRGPHSSGAGLGLAIARGIVESHGGVIAVLATTDGTTATVRLAVEPT